jgi:hypothetical protein
LLLFRKEAEAIMRRHDLYKPVRGSPGTTEDDGDDDFGEGFDIDAVKPTLTLLDAFGLTGEAKRRPIELALTSDGAHLTNTLLHVAAGLKFNDMAMRDPMTTLPLLLHGPDSLVQSRNQRQERILWR